MPIFLQHHFRRSAEEDKEGEYLSKHIGDRLLSLKPSMPTLSTPLARMVPISSLQEPKASSEVEDLFGSRRFLNLQESKTS
ncbi:hypothetical protein L6452_38975 [Arctium lappa]|uniref:Uncharacterized protein n=1 Tax=Arctium lappa TaxID=4217 RepID=A0ACB8XRX7_ARCLA|nr:hypothetical protein L6452_38975 [Arctium lappa]